MKSNRKAQQAHDLKQVLGFINSVTVALKAENARLKGGR